MKKYWTIIKTEFQRQFTYRVNILAYVVGNFIGLFSQVIVWYIAYQYVDNIRGYSYQEMMSYVIIGWFFLFLTTNYGFETIIARDVHTGAMSNFLTKPMSYLRYVITKSIGRVIVAFMVVILQGMAYIVLFKQFLVFSLSMEQAIVLGLMLIGSFFIKVFFAIIIGLIAFWSIDVKGVFALANVVIRFFSGAYFPLSIFSGMFVNISLLLPFAYTHFIPAQFYIGKVSTLSALGGIGIQILWLGILYIIIKLIWKVGIKQYESVGA
ncbi:ABC-2 family transporter protein [Candidatus Parcubacteria bacterium]|nr:ABC-2 family transporter protein [Candidatus Parcubacteria bacterium]